MPQAFPASKGSKRSERRLVLGHSPIVQHGLRPPVLRPAGDIIANSDRPLLAVGDGPHPGWIDPLARQEASDRRGPAGAERDIVFARAALVGMALDRDGVLRVLVEPARLIA